jgi:hypothetical protein
MKIPQPTLSIINQAIVEKAEKKPSRNYMGGSILGEPCDRKLWYSFKTPSRILDPRILRIMDLGNMIESMVIEYLRNSGLTVYDIDQDGKQFGFEDGFLAGNIDGVVTGLLESSKPHLFECKSAKDSRFKLFVKNGIKETEPKYWAQIQVYMKYMELDRCLYIIYNKDTSEMHIERIKYNAMEADYYANRGKEIGVKEEADVERKYKGPAWRECRYCDYREKCWNLEEGR